MLVVNDKNFKEEIEEGLVLVDFYADWCGPCKMISPVLQNVKAELGDKVKIIKVDVEASQDLAQEHGVISIPTLILFKDGEALDRTGFLPKPAMVKFIEKGL